MRPNNATTFQEDNIVHKFFVIWEYPATSEQNMNKIFLTAENFPNSFHRGDQCFLQTESQNGGILGNELAQLRALETQQLKELNFGSQDFVNISEQYLGFVTNQKENLGFRKPKLFEKTEHRQGVLGESAA